MYFITLAGGPRERGRSQGAMFATEMRSLLAECQDAWLGGMPAARVAFLRGNMVAYLRGCWPELIQELEGIAEGADLPFDDVCTLNFVSAIGALGPRCSNLIVRESEAGPVLAKTSDIGEDYRYYSLQHVVPDAGPACLAVSWIGCLWAEAGLNAHGLAVGQGSAPIQPGQDGSGVPTLQYPRIFLSQCAGTQGALELGARLPMAGKGLNIAMVDAGGDAAVMERSGTAYAVRRPESDSAVYCTNHFVHPDMQSMIPLTVPDTPAEEILADSTGRLQDIGRFVAAHRSPVSRDEILDLLRRPRAEGGLAQNVPPGRVTHFAYLLAPALGEMWVSQGKPWETEFVRYTP